MPKLKRKLKGFTIVELAAVVLIIVVMAAIAFPLYQKTIERSRTAEVQSLFASVISGQRMQMTTAGSYTADWDDFRNSIPQIAASVQGSVYCLKGANTPGQSGCGADALYEVQIHGTDNESGYISATRVGSAKFGPYALYRYYNSQDTCCSAQEAPGREFCEQFDSSCGKSGSWKDGEWTGSCPTPWQDQPTETQCTMLGGGFTGGVATRECDANCNGGTCGGWDTSACIIDCDATQKPAESQPCASGCGTETRTATCNFKTGQWQVTAWSGACSSPTQTNTTEQSCNSGCGTQKRTCSATCGGGTCGDWGACSAPAPTQTNITSQRCDSLLGSSYGGTATRTCQESCSGGTCGNWNYSGCYELCNYSCYGPSYEERACSSGCGTETRYASCDSCTGNYNWGSWSGSCSSKYLNSSNQSTSASCSSVAGSGYTGTAYRSCTADCSGGYCTGWDISGCKAPCVQPPQPPRESAPCTDGFEGTRYGGHYWDQASCSWRVESNLNWDTSGCTRTCHQPSKPPTMTQSCYGPNGYGTQTCVPVCGSDYYWRHECTPCQ